MALFTFFVIHLLIIEINYIGTSEEIESFPDSSLHGPADKVVLLTAYELEEKLYNSTTAWLVQFYDSQEDPWVTICKTSFTFWKQFAASIFNWQEIIRVGVFDCLGDRDTDWQFCEKHEAGGYSTTVRYYPPLLKNINFIEHVPAPRNDSSNPLAPAWRAAIIKHLQNTKKKPLYWPDLSPLSSGHTTETIWRANNGGLFVLVVETVESYVGRELIMDLYAARVVVQYTNNMEFANPKEKLPQILVIKPDEENGREQVRLTNTTREGVYQAVRSHLQKEGFTIPHIQFDTQLDNDKNPSPEVYPNTYAQCQKILTRALQISKDKIDKDKCSHLRELTISYPTLSKFLFPKPKN